jgi:tetratricopeptide (TPR) repeat protein
MQRLFSGHSRIALVAALAVTGLPGLAASPQLQPSATAIQNDLSPELRGDLAMARQQYLAAIEAYRQAPLDSAQIWNKLGLAYHHVFAIEEAQRDYLRALRIRPNYPEALNNLGAVYYAKGNFHRAEKYYLRALRLNSNSAATYSNLGTAYFAQHKADKGLVAYRTALALDARVFEDAAPQLVSESLPARERAQQDYALAVLFAQSGHSDRAIEYLRKALNEGFDDRKRILDDQTLASVRALPAFTELMCEQKLR